MRSKAERRHHDHRMIEHAIHSEKLQGYSDSDDFTAQYRRAKLFHNNLTPCSCPMCCNPRKNGWLKNKEKMTMPERRNLEKFNDQMEEIEGT